MERNELRMIDKQKKVQEQRETKKNVVLIKNETIAQLRD